MRRPRIQLVTTTKGHHARIVATNGEPIAWTETHPDERDALNAVRVLAETFAVGPVHFPDAATPDARQLWIGLPDGGDEYLGIPIERIDETTDPGAAGEEGEADPAAPVEGEA